MKKVHRKATAFKATAMQQKVASAFKHVIFIIAAFIKAVNQLLLPVKKTLKPVVKRLGKLYNRYVRQPHKTLMSRWKWYGRWHSYKWSRAVHRTALGFGALTFVLVSSNFIGPASALSTWQQTDWSGGMGTSTANQYASIADIDMSVSGQFSLAKGTNAFTNPGFESGVTSWNGINRTAEATTKRTGNGGAKLTVPTDTPAPFYAKTDTALPTALGRYMNVGDFNNDGITDAVTTDDTGKVQVYLGTGSGTFSTPTGYDITPTRAARDATTADFDKDGDIDFAVSNDNSGIFTVFYNGGNGTSFTSTDFTGPSSPRDCTLTSADFNSDGAADLAFICNVVTGFHVFYNNGTGGFPTKTTYPGAVGSTSQTTLVALDYNGDGRPDLAQSNNGACGYVLAINNGAGFDAAQVRSYPTCGGGGGGTSYSGGAGDINNDGYEDFVTSYRIGSNDATYPAGASFILVSPGNASGVLQAEAIYRVADGSYRGSTPVVDINSDGWKDIVSVSWESHNYSVLINNGDGTFAPRTDYAAGTNPFDVEIGDFNGDKKPDLTFLNRTSATVSIATNRLGGETITQMVNAGSTDKHQLEAYVRTNGSAVTTADASLYYNGNAISTTYTDAGSGWYKLSAVVTAANEKRSYGVHIKPGKTVYVDDMALYKYRNSGAMRSATLDLGYGGDWGTVTYAQSSPGVTVRMRTSNNADMSGAPNVLTCPALTSGTDITGQTCITNNHRYIQYHVTLTPVDGNTPVFTDFSLEYTPWDTIAPDTNASAISMKRSAGGQDVASGEWSNGPAPYFAWAAGADNSGGSGIKGYCMYLGQDSTADPATTKGVLGTSPLDTGNTCPFAVSTTSIDLSAAGLLATPLASSNSPYYAIFKAIDTAHNVFAGSGASFSFKFDNTPPANPAFITAPSQFIATKQVTFTWPTNGNDAPKDDHSGLAGLQYKIGTSPWYGDQHNGAQDSSDMLTNDGSYTTTTTPDFANIQEGNNTVSFRTWDQAGNATTNYVTTAIRLNTSSPSSPQNITATPQSNATNSFAFSWDQPATFAGPANSLTYCYTINTLPTVNTCTYAPPGVTGIPAGPYATQPGENTFYVVAKDEAGNINYATAGSVTFTANTAAPGMPLDTEIADVSTKSTASWKLALSWSQPSDVGAGVASYRVYRSTNNISFTQVASTGGSSYVDSGLAQLTYYYKVRACDSTNNCGAYSATVDKLPTGRFTEPPELIGQPSVSVSTRSATIRWTTGREADSRVQYGFSSGDYFTTEAAISNPTKTHTLDLTNLEAGRTYFYKVKWTDEDGNTGTSPELSFTTSPAPVIKNVEIRRLTTSTASIQFTVKDATQVKFYYGKSEGFGGVETINTSRSESTYSVELDGLDDGATYFYAFNPVDTDGNEYKSSRIDTFATPQRPRISNVRLQPLPDEPTSTQTVTWTTNVPATSRVRYTPQNEIAKEVTDSKLKTEHSMTIRDLSDNTLYEFVAESRDKEGTLAASDVQKLQTALDTRPPKISEITVEASIRGTGAEARGQIIVSWKTDEPSTSQVAYAEGSAATVFTNRTSEDTKLTRDHIVIVSDLPTSKVYSVRPIASDAAGNSGTGTAESAIIGRASDSVMTIVLNTLQRVFGF